MTKETTRLIGALLIALFVVGCNTTPAVNQGDAKIVNQHDADGNLLTSTQTVSGVAAVDIEMEKTRQVCYENRGKAYGNVTDPTAQVAIEALNKLAGDNGCAGSTNSNDLALGKNSNMHQTIRSATSDVLSFGKFGLGAAAIGKVADKLGNGSRVNTGDNARVTLGNGSDYNENIKTGLETTPLDLNPAIGLQSESEPEAEQEVEVEQIFVPEAAPTPEPDEVDLTEE